MPLTTATSSDAKEPFVKNSLPQHNPGLLREVGSFLLRRKKWYLIPIVCVIALTGLLIVLGGTAAAPFIYSFW
jgi:hypothetical protein